MGTISDWGELFKQAYRVLKPGGWIETFECNGFYESDDGTLTDKTSLSKWGYFFREGALKLGSTASFSVVRDGLQVKGLEEANFTRITENHIKVRPVPFSSFTCLFLFVFIFWLKKRPMSSRDIEG